MRASRRCAARCKGRAEAVAEKIRVELEQRGLLGEPLGVDIVELPVLRALEAAGITVVDGQALMQDIRMVKTIDEITLLNTACAMVDAAYDDLFKAMKPGMRENECVALVSKRLFELGSEHIEGVNAISGERCSPHPHVFTDRMLRPGDPAYFDILHAYNGYRTCYYRTFAVGSASPRARRRVQALPRHPRPRDLADPARRDDRRGRRASGRRRRSSASRTRRRRSRSSTGTASASRAGRSRSSAGSSRSTTPR